MQITFENDLKIALTMEQENEITRREVFHMNSVQLVTWEIKHEKKIDDEIRRKTCNKCSRFFTKKCSSKRYPVKFIATDKGNIIWWHSICLKPNHDPDSSKT